jgi:hypothetical protein
MPKEIQEIYTASALSTDPARFNLFTYVLNPEGKVVHSFHGHPSGARPVTAGRSDYPAEIAKALTLLWLPADKVAPQERPVVLPDLPKGTADVPAGVRLYLDAGKKESGRSPFKPVVEVVAMPAEEWSALAYPEQARAIEVERLRAWLLHLYPPAIRASDQSRPFEKFTGTLTLEPAGADKDARYALLRGKVVLSKKDESQSSFEGKLEAVVRYDPTGPKVRKLCGVLEGEYLYREPGRQPGAMQRIALRAAIQSRPD